MSSTQKIIQFSLQYHSPLKQLKTKDDKQTFNENQQQLIAHQLQHQSQLAQSNIQIATNNADESFKKTNKGRQRKKKGLKQVEYQILNYCDQQICQQVNYQEKEFVFSGGVVIDLEWNNRSVGRKCYKSIIIDHCRNRFNDGFIQIYVKDYKTSKEYDLAIQLLERMQNQDFYYISQLMKLYKISTILLENQIEMIKSISQEQDLLEIINKREQFLQSKALELSQQHLNGDEFTFVVTFQIKWEASSIYLSSLYFSQAILALLGTVSTDLILQIMRNGSFQLFTGYSVRMITELNMKFMLNQIKNDWVEIPDFELMALDGIIVRCNCQIKIQSINYPENLQFDDTNNSSINNIESVVLTKCNLTKEKLHNLIQLRQQIIKENSSHKSQYEEVEWQQNQVIAQNFDYYLQSELFLQKFYAEKYQNLVEQNNKSKQICSYKYIS